MAGLLVEDSGNATGGQKIDLYSFTFGPKPQQFHQPSLGSAHTEAVDNLENPNGASWLHKWSPRSSLSALSIFIGDSRSAVSAATRDGAGWQRSSIAASAQTLG